VLDRLDSGVILVNTGDVPVYANTQALIIVAESDGLALNGGLTSTTPKATRRLRTALAQAASDSAVEPVRLALELPSHRPPLQLAFLPIWRLGAAVSGAGNASIATFLTMPGCNALDRTPDGRRCLQADKARERSRRASRRGTGSSSHR